MADWSVEELQDWDNKICKLGKELQLDWYPNLMKFVIIKK